MKVKAVIFDQDETLIHPETGLYDSYVEERARDFARAYNIEDLEEARERAFKMKIEKCDDSTIALYDMMGVPRSVWYDKINTIDVKPFLRPAPELRAFLKELKDAGLFVFLLTNSPTHQTCKIFEASGVSPETFDRMFTWEAGKEPPKPSKKPFQAIMEEFKLAPEECVMVGNEIKVDLRTAHTLGIRTVGINLETPADAYVDFTIDKLDDLVKVIRRIERKFV